MLVKQPRQDPGAAMAMQGHLARDQGAATREYLAQMHQMQMQQQQQQQQQPAAAAAAAASSAVAAGLAQGANAQSDAEMRALVAAYQQQYASASPEVQRAMHQLAAAQQKERLAKQQQQQQQQQHAMPTAATYGAAKPSAATFQTQQQQHQRSKEEYDADLEARMLRQQHLAYQRQLMRTQQHPQQTQQTYVGSSRPGSNATSPAASNNASPTAAASATSDKERQVLMMARALTQALEQQDASASHAPMSPATAAAYANLVAPHMTSIGSEAEIKAAFQAPALHHSFPVNAASPSAMSLRDLSLPQLLNLLPQSMMPGASQNSSAPALQPPLPPAATAASMVHRRHSSGASSSTSTCSDDHSGSTGRVDAYCKKRAAALADLAKYEVARKLARTIKEEQVYSNALGPNAPMGSGQHALSRGKPRGKLCNFIRCDKLARGRGYCKRHGGGRRCESENCLRSARSGSKFCTSHGGGRRCQTPGCTKGAEGATYHCVAHGGGKRCQHEGCTKKDQGSGYCKSHGGGKRCAIPACMRSVKTGTDLCSQHWMLREDNGIVSGFST
ncbi:Hypothetical Protein FCC1311_000462 [Hondaea fermentalgiana]|uniref:WRKY19-like zinc finger domain-containing protein n=1 Tax=Hondaea fermentalgiana TaxID=2315210 RepID=A0A2R5FYI5_9STRA|nr:Hypothetical Protein FCC1311_000462 [Hondaea fermentalgiana]|eukprot:GBG23826.1 Hypothetical Protein FCC1311_000462 [Hondaea fermentalgiana]